MPKAVGYLQGSSPRTACVDLKPCVVLRLGRLEILSSSFVYYVISASVLMQALVFVSVGAMADYGSNRKRMLILATIIGVTASLLMLTVVRPSLFLYAALLSIMMNIAFGTATVFYNAYFPLLVSNYHAAPHDIEVMSEEMSTSKGDDRSTSSPINEHERLKLVDNVSSYISTRGFIVGYLGSFIVLALSCLFAYLRPESFFSLQICIAFCGVWWLAFSIFPFLKLKTRPGPRLPAGTNYLFFSWKKVYNTLRKCKQLPVTFWFLLCFFLFSDGYATMGSVAVIFAKTEMNAPDEKVIIAALITPFSSIIGNFLFFYVQKWTKMSSKTCLMILLGLMGLIPCYGVVGLITDKFGLHHQWEIFAFAIAYGFIVGALQSYARVIFSELIPPGDESEFFSLYAITDKGSSWLGPLFQSLLLGWTGNSRYGLIVLAAMMWLPIPVIASRVDMERGVKDAKEFHVTL